MPTHNRLEILKRAVLSVLEQTYTNFELIIVNDGSKDGTKNYLDALSIKEQRVKVFHNIEAMGACYCRNLAIKSASGVYITGLDDDDVFLKNRLEDFFYHKEKLNTYSFLSSAIGHITESTDLEVIKKVYDSCSVISLPMLTKENCVGNQVFTYTERLKEINGFDENLLAWQDYDTWLRVVLKYGNGINIPNMTYLQDVTVDRTRITTSKRKLQGIKRFIEKHNKVLHPNLVNRYMAYIDINGIDCVIPDVTPKKWLFLYYKLLYKILYKKRRLLENRN